MHLSGQTEIEAGRRRVWDAVTDPHQVAGCVPGQPKVEVVDDRHMKVTAVVGSGFLRTTVVVAGLARGTRTVAWTSRP